MNAATEQLLNHLAHDQDGLEQATECAGLLGPTVTDDAIGAFAIGTLAGIESMLPGSVPWFGQLSLQEIDWATLGARLRGILDNDGGTPNARRWWTMPRPG